MNSVSSARLANPIEQRGLVAVMNDDSARKKRKCLKCLSLYSPLAAEVDVYQSTIFRILRSRFDGLSNSALHLCEFISGSREPWRLAGQSRVELQRKSSVWHICPDKSAASGAARTDGPSDSGSLWRGANAVFQSIVGASASGPRAARELRASHDAPVMSREPEARGRETRATLVGDAFRLCPCTLGRLYRPRVAGPFAADNQHIELNRFTRLRFRRRDGHLGSHRMSLEQRKSPRRKRPPRARPSRPRASGDS